MVDRGLTLFELIYLDYNDISSISIILDNIKIGAFIIKNIEKFQTSLYFTLDLMDTILI